MLLLCMELQAETVFDTVWINCMVELINNCDELPKNTTWWSSLKHEVLMEGTVGMIEMKITSLCFAHAGLSTAHLLTIYSDGWLCTRHSSSQSCSSLEEAAMIM